MTYNKPLNLIDRLVHLLNNSEHSDFYFYIKEDGTRIPVHKLIVGACSAVLYNIVYGSNTEFVLAVDYSVVDDISRSQFMEVLRYMYTDKVKSGCKFWYISITNVFIFIACN